jgi:CheY-like chemotaxis protein
MRIPSIVSSGQGPGGLTLTLLADRDRDARTLYAEYLRRSGCAVEEAEDGREALAKVLSRHPDIVVTQTWLPGIDGFQLCQLLRADVTTENIPIVFVAREAFTQDVDRAHAFGATAVLVKPLLPERLLLELRRVLVRTEALRARVRTATDTALERLERANELVDEVRRATRRPLSKSLPRFQTTDPPVRPPALVCPACDSPLQYDHSNVGGVSVHHVEQWDYYECSLGCGTFQYRPRTRKLRRVM